MCQPGTAQWCSRTPVGQFDQKAWLDSVAEYFFLKLVNYVRHFSGTRLQRRFNGVSIAVKRNTCSCFGGLVQSFPLKVNWVLFGGTEEEKVTSSGSISDHSTILLPIPLPSLPVNYSDLHTQTNSRHFVHPLLLLQLVVILFDLRIWVFTLSAKLVAR